MPATQAPLFYDPFAADVIADPYPWYRRLQDEAPLYRQEPLDFWVLSRYADVLAGARAHGVLSSAESVTYARAPIPMMLTMDPPDHTRLRRLVARDFTPTAVSQWRPLVERLASEAVDAMLAAGTVDLVAELASPLPVKVIAEVLGVPAADYAQFREWSDLAVESLALTDPDDSERAARAIGGILGMQAYFAGLVEERRRQPRNDMVSRLVQPREEGALTSDEVFWFCLLLLVAGNETTTNLLGNILLVFAQHPDQWELVRARPELVPLAIEESVRRDAPIQGLFRTAVAPYRVGDAEVPVGGRVLLLFGAANRDPRRFDDPDTFLVDRGATDHLGFGSGIHLCLGAHLARLEGTVVLTQLVERVRRVELAGDAVRGTNPILRGMARLPLALVPA
jgi:beta-dihydromenaquinone-9 omega-hydroxylase